MIFLFIRVWMQAFFTKTGGCSKRRIRPIIHISQQQPLQREQSPPQLQ